MIIAATSALAESGLTPLPAPEARPYPYRILDLQPGDPLEDVLARFAERSETPPTGETGTMRVQSPTGGSFEFSFETYKRIGDTGMYARMAGEPQDATTAMLSTEVMEQRPLSLSRIIEQPSGELPQLLELKAQIEELLRPALEVRD